MSVAFVHDWLVEPGGAELVLAEALRAFPGAPVLSLIDKMSAENHAALELPRAQTSWLQSVPGVRTRYRSMLPLMPSAMKALRPPPAETLVAISHAVAQGIRPLPGQTLLVLSLSPMRYAWDLREQYLRESGLGSGVKGQLARRVLDRMQRWDLANSKRVHGYASISNFIAARVKRAYGRDSEVIYPPVDTDYFTPSADNRELTKYVTASRFVPYKRVDLIVRAFVRMPNRKLVVIGDGPDDAKVRAAANGAPNITFAGRLSREQVRRELRTARAFVFAAEEDFGIAPVEAQACGTPVVAYGVGGAVETVVERRTGTFFADQSAGAIVAAVERLDDLGAAVTPEACRENALRFSASRFRTEFTSWVERASAI